MVIKVENKDLVLDDSGAPVMVDGLEQALQQLQMAAVVEKGKFIYDREMGMRLIDTNILAQENKIDIIECMLNELLIDVPGVTVTVNSIYNSLRIKTAYCTITDGFNSIDGEVNIYENV